MARRFSRIEQGEVLNEALIRYRQYQTERLTRARRVGQGTPRGASVQLVIDPFGLPAASSIPMRVRVSQRSRTIMDTGVGTHAVAPTTARPGTRQPGFEPAKVVMFARAGEARTATSQITGQPYLRRPGASYTHAFGAQAANEAEMEAYSEIVSALADPLRSFSYKPERHRQG